MKFKNYITVFVLSVCSSFTYAGNGGGTGGNFPTNGSIISIDMGNSAITIQPNKVITNLKVDSDFTVMMNYSDVEDTLGWKVSSEGLSEGNSNMPDLLDLSDYEVKDRSRENSLSGYSMLSIVNEKNTLGFEKSDTILKEDLLATIGQMQKLTLDMSAISIYIKSTENIKSGKADLMLITDEEDKIILMNSSKIK